MPSEAATAIAYVGAFVGLVGGGVALFNSWKAVCWKRAELANSYMKDFNNNPELVFAGRCLDWNGGRLILPESLRPYMPDNAQTIQHDRRVFAQALRPDLPLSGMDEDPRIQIYRTSMDSFLTWLCLVASALDRKLFLVADIQDVGYWVAKKCKARSYCMVSSLGMDIRRISKNSSGSIATRSRRTETGCFR
jgi:hypothetical protein